MEPGIKAKQEISALQNDDPIAAGTGIGVKAIDSLSNNEIEKILIQSAESLPGGKEVIEESRKYGWQLPVAVEAIRLVTEAMYERRVKPEFEHQEDQLDSIMSKNDSVLLKEILQRLDTIKDSNPERYTELLDRLINAHIKG